MAPTSPPTTYGLLLFPGFEVLDAAGPIEILNTLSFHLGYSNITLSVIAASLDPLTPAPATSSHQFTSQQVYKPTHTFATAPQVDVLIVPGGVGTRESREQTEGLCKFIRDSYLGENGREKAKHLFSICTGSQLFAEAGVLDGHKATTNKRAWKSVTSLTTKTHWVAKARWVESPGLEEGSGDIWTCSGVSAGIDGMVAFVAKFYGDEVAERVCQGVEHVRVTDAGDDPFAGVNGCEDVLPA